MSIGKVISGILAGAAVGIIAGILIAPDKGSETRKKIVKKGNDISDAFKDSWCNIGDAITRKYEQIKSDAMDLMDEMERENARSQEEMS